MLTMEERAFFIRLLREDAGAAQPSRSACEAGQPARHPAPRETNLAPSQACASGKTP